MEVLIDFLLTSRIIPHNEYPAILFYMSKTIEVSYGLSIMMGEHWQKISVRQVPDDNETMETVLDEVSERIKSWHKKKYPNMYGEKNKTIGIEHGASNVSFPDDENEEWEAIKNTLTSIKFREDAQEFINTTQYSMTIEAKKLINEKISKHE